LQKRVEALLVAIKMTWYNVKHPESIRSQSLSKYFLYLDETGTFKGQKKTSDQWIIGGLYGQQHQQLTRNLDEFETELERLVGPKFRHASDLDNKQKKALLAPIVLFLAENDLSLIYITHLADRYLSDKGSSDLRYTHQMMEFLSNMIGRNPFRYKHHLDIHIEASGVRKDDLYVPRFNTQIFKTTWQVYQDQGLVEATNAFKVRTYNKKNSPFLINLADILLNLLQHHQHSITLQQALLEHNIPLISFGYGTTSDPQAIYEKLFAAALKQQWFEFCECFCQLQQTLDSERHWPLGMQETYQRLADKLRENAKAIWKQDANQSQQALSWMDWVLESKIIGKYVFLPEILNHLAPEVKKTELYDKCFRQWSNHQGKNVIRREFKQIQSPENVLGMINGEQVKRTHVFEFAEALETVNQVCQIRVGFFKAVQAIKPELFDPWLGMFLSQRGQLKAYLHQFPEALVAFEEALVFFEGNDQKNRIQTLSHALLAAIEAQDSKRIATWRSALLNQFDNPPLETLIQGLENYQEKIVATNQAFLLRALLKAQTVQSDAGFLNLLNRVSPESVIFQAEKPMHPLEMILLSWARLAHPTHPDLARRLLKTVAKMYPDSSSVLYFVSLAAYMWQGVLFGDANVVAEGIRHLEAVKGQHKSILNASATAGWFAPVFTTSDSQKQAKTYLSLMRYGLS